LLPKVDAHRKTLGERTSREGDQMINDQLRAVIDRALDCERISVEDVESFSARCSSMG
jgi:hypothetical protein